MNNPRWFMPRTGTRERVAGVWKSGPLAVSVGSWPQGQPANFPCLPTLWVRRLRAWEALSLTSREPQLTEGLSYHPWRLPLSDHVELPYAGGVLRTLLRHCCSTTPLSHPPSSISHLPSHVGDGTQGFPRARQVLQLSHIPRLCLKSEVLRTSDSGSITASRTYRKPPSGRLPRTCLRIQNGVPGRLREELGAWQGTVSSSGYDWD
jgi:hypothetical protein